MRISDWSSDVCSSDLRAAPIDRHMVKGNRLQHYAGQYRVPHRKAALHAIGGLDNRRTQSRPLIKADAINLERERRYHHLSARSGLTGAEKIGRAHVCTPVTNAHLICSLPLEKKK